MSAFLTIFTAPKSFTDAHIATIQKNAIRSWQQLGDNVEIILVGDEPGISEVSAELNVRHLSQVRCNELGTPLVSSIFEQARSACQTPILAYLNADILVLQDFLRAAFLVASREKDFLIIGQRWDLDVHREMDFSTDWDARLRSEVKLHGRLHPPVGSDYFIFPRHLLTDMPDFAIGRAGWDNWVIYHGVRSGWAVVDATHSVQVVHQNHSYNHLPDGKLHYDLEESRQNIALGGGFSHLYTVLEANRVLNNGKIYSKRSSLAQVLRYLEFRLMDGSQRGIKWSLLRRIRRLRRRITGSYRDESIFHL